MVLSLLKTFDDFEVLRELMRHPQEIWKVLSVLPADHHYRHKIAELINTPLVEYLILLIDMLAIDSCNVKVAATDFLSGLKGSFCYQINWLEIHKNSSQFDKKHPRPRKSVVDSLKKFIRSREMLTIIVEKLDQALVKLVRNVVVKLKTM